MKSNYLQQHWLQAIHEGSNKTKFEYCMNSKNQVPRVCALQGHTGGSMMSPELIGHFENLYKWKRCIFHVDPPITRILLRTRDSFLVEERRKEKDNWFSSRRTIHLEKILLRRHKLVSHSVQKSTLPQCLESQTRCDVFGQIGSRTRCRFAILAKKIQCSCH